MRAFQIELPMHEELVFELDKPQELPSPVSLPVVDRAPLSIPFEVLEAWPERQASKSSGLVLVAFVLGLIVLGLVLSGCTSVSDEARTQIKHGAAVGDGELADWVKLTDEQKHEDLWKLTRVLHDLDWSLFGVPVPKEFQNDPWASKAPPGGGK